MKHEGHVALVTGAGQGIGREYALALAKDGASVVLADINIENAQAVESEITDFGGSALAAHVDVSDAASVAALASRVEESYGHVHILVNNAAMFHSIRLEPQMSVSVEYWRRVFAVNVEGVLLVTQSIAPLIIRAGWGRIVNQASTVAHLGGSGAYGCSKLAVIGLTHGFARELGEYGICVNAIAPDIIHTDALLSLTDEDRRERVIAQSALKRKAYPHDLVGTLRFLCGEESAWMTGQTLVVDGGTVMPI
jgi:NAD(P)-dependent dehydrogenase (short-subunit alcohol dehydrogenase family)